MSTTRSATGWLASSASAVNRGKRLRMSLPSKLCPRPTVPVRKPCPSGDQGTNPMPSSAQAWQHLRVGLPGPDRVLVLNRGNRLDGVGAADGVRPGLGQAEVGDLPGVDQVLHSAGDVLERHLGVDAVLVQQVDPVGPKPAQRLLDRGTDGVGSAVQTGAFVPLNPKPNLVAMMTWSRIGASASPTRVSLVKGP